MFLKLSSASPECFIHSVVVEPATLQWFRISAAVFHWLILVKRSMEPERLPMFCYLTNLVFLTGAIYFTLAALNYWKSSSSGTHVLKYSFRHSFLLIIYSVVTCFSIIVSLLYFGLVYDPKKDVLGVTNVSRHILNSLVVGVDLGLNSIPLSSIDSLWPVMFALLYVIFTLLFWHFVEAPENWIYKVLDWNKPQECIVLLLVLFVFLLCLQYGLVRLTQLKTRGRLRAPVISTNNGAENIFSV